MTIPRDDILRMAREAAGPVLGPALNLDNKPFAGFLERFVALVAAAEREACAAACEDIDYPTYESAGGAITACAAACRARGAA